MNGACSHNKLTIKVSDFPSDYPPFTPEHHDRQSDGSPWTPDAVLSHGRSCIVGPLGEFLAEPVVDKDEILYAELKRDDLIGSRVGELISDLQSKRLMRLQMDFDVVGSYSRPDIL